MNIRFEFYFQTEGWNCGPTALYIAYKPMKFYKETTIEEISKLCEADNILGTTDERMKKGLVALNIKHSRSTGLNKETAIPWLKERLNQGDIFLLRGLVKGIKHWVVVTKYYNGFHILDPWLGEYNLGETEILEIWEPREFDGFILNKENYVEEK